MSHWLAPKNRCITWRTVILSDLLHNWKRGVETVVVTEKQSNPWAIWIERSIDDYARGN